MKDKNLVIGAGFSGATLARILSDAGEKVLVVDKRSHVGGISYDYKDENNITVHKFGSHIFHTKNSGVWNFLRRFTEFNTYMHRVNIIIDRIETHIPFNLDTISDLFPKFLSDKLQKKTCRRIRLQFKSQHSGIPQAKRFRLKSFWPTLFMKKYFMATA